ncbi:MAG: XRE family transcriptional regulator [Pseudorhodoplanes sp.]
MSETRMSGRLIAAARVLTGITQKVLAAEAKVAPDALKLMEADDAALLPASRDVAAVRRALEHFGAVFIADGGGMGAGVRLKFSRLDVKQIGRLENEGGPAADDDVP